MLEKKQDINYLIIKMLELYELLENYIWTHSNKNYHIIIHDKEESLEIKFMKEDKLLDSFILTFNEKEKNIHEYISLSYMYNLFRYVTTFNDGNKIYNKTHKPYLAFIEEDSFLLSKCQILGYMINNSQNKEINKILEAEYLKLKRKDRTIDNNIKTCIDQRLILTKKIFQGGIYE